MNASPQNTILCRFAIVTDLHYGSSCLGNRACPDSLGKLRRCINLLNQHGVPLLLDLGDSIDFAESMAQEADNARAIAFALNEFHGETRLLLGNHDLEHFSKTEYLAYMGGGTPNYAFTSQGVRFLVLDGNCHEDGSDYCAGNFSWDRAWVSSSQINWLVDELTRDTVTPTVICCHENLDARHDDPHVVRNMADVGRVITGAPNVRLVLQGHYHPGIFTRIGAVPCFGGTALVVGEGEENIACAIVSIMVDGTVEVEGFERQESGRWEDGWDGE